MYQADLLTTDNPDSTLDNLSENELKNAFNESGDQPSLSNTDLSKLESFIETHASNGNSRINKLGKLLGTTQKQFLVHQWFIPDVLEYRPRKESDRQFVRKISS